jgi:hypothetical protein
MPQLKIKEELHYRKGSGNEAENCRFCRCFTPDYEVIGKVFCGVVVRIEGRCSIVGFGNSPEYMVRMDYRCDAHRYSGDQG